MNLHTVVIAFGCVLAAVTAFYFMISAIHAGIQNELNDDDSQSKDDEKRQDH